MRTARAVSRVAFSLAWVATSCGALSAQIQSDETVELQGVLQVGTFYGPPGYRENPATDRMETSYYLQLPDELTVDPSAVPPDARSLPRWIYFVQLIAPTSDPQVQP